MEWFVIGVLLVTCIMLLYVNGHIPRTTPHYEVRMRQYYLSLLQSKSCDALVDTMDNIDSELAHYMIEHEDELDKIYPKEPLQLYVHSLRCVDADTGEPLTFGGAIDD